MRFTVESRFKGLIANGVQSCRASELHSVLIKETRAGNSCVVKDDQTGGIFECIEESDVNQCLQAIEERELEIQRKQARVKEMLVAFGPHRHLAFNVGDKPIVVVVR